MNSLTALLVFYVLPAAIAAIFGARIACYGGCLRVADALAWFWLSFAPILNIYGAFRAVSVLVADSGILYREIWSRKK